MPEKIIRTLNKHQYKHLQIFLLLLTAFNASFATAVTYSKTSLLKMKITSIKAPACATPGKTFIAIRGRNFGKPYGKSLLYYNKKSRIPGNANSWGNSYITATVPASRLFQRGRKYYVRIEQRIKGRYIRSNTIAAFTVCKRYVYPSRGRIITRGVTVPVSPGGRSTTPPADTGTPSDSSIPETPGTPQPGSPQPGTPGAGLGSTLPEAVTAPTNTNTPKGQGRFIPRQVMLTSTNLKQANKMYSELTALGYKIKSRRNFKNLGIVLSVFRTPDGVSANDAVASLRGKYKKATIDRNSIYHFNAGKARTLKYMEKIQWPASAANCGKGLRIGILDSQVDRSHSAFRSRKLVQKSFITAGLKPAPLLHATAISSQWIGNPDSGIAGLVPSATVYAASVFYIKGRTQQSNTQLLLAGLDWLAQNRVDVVNLSFGGPRNLVLEIALKKLMRKNISIVASAGNGGAQGAPVYPAAQTGVVAVTAVTGSNRIYRHATRGNYIDLAAPGVNIWVAKPGNGKKVVSGTSFAAPYVSAALLVLKPVMRNHKSRIRWLKKKAQKLGAASIYGKGLLQVPGACRR